MRVREREREREREGESKHESEVVERKKVLLPSSPNPNFREVHTELSRNCCVKLRYNPGFPAFATYDGRHSIETELR